MATGGAGGGVGLLGASFDLSAGFAFNLLSILCAGNSSELPPLAPAMSGDWLGPVRLGRGGEGGGVWKGGWFGPVRLGGGGEGGGVLLLFEGLSTDVFGFAA